MILEIACNSFQSCVHAYKGGADRIELFENLPEGGCTPSYGMIKKVKETIPLPVYVMIRPRGGDFIYSEDEFSIMQEDVKMCKELGVDGIVFGILTKDLTVDQKRNQELLQNWGSRKATFHRAVDRCRNIEEAVCDIIRLGFERILCSGGKKTAWEGRKALEKIQEDYGNKIIIMPGSGICADNVIEIINETKCREIHATCKKEAENRLLSGVDFEDRFQESNLSEIQKLVAKMNL